MAVTLGKPGSSGGGLMVIDFDPELVIIMAELFDIADGLSDLREPLERAVREVAVPAISRNFDLEGPGWPGHAEATVNRPDYTGHPILNLSGALYEAATDPGIWEIDDDQASVDSADTLWYGPIHDAGGDFIPQRQFFFFTDGDLSNIEDIFLDHIEGVLAVHGFRGGVI